MSRSNARVKWYKGRTLIQASDKYKVISKDCRRALVIRACTFEDEKKYVCDADDVRTYAKLVVQRE